MKIVDGKNAVLGRLASYVAKEALRGEEIKVVNCEQVIITGNREFIEKQLLQKRARVGTRQIGPKVSRMSEKIVKRAIRGMLPDHRVGRGKEAFKRIMCYTGTPTEFKDSKKISFNDEDKLKYIKVKDISR
jgi:large subunit ribosomal protein L13